MISGTNDQALQQQTISKPVTVSGRGYLSGVETKLRFLPAPVDSGITFIRTDLPDAPEIPARISSVIPRQRRTAIAKGSAIVEMIEHVLAALTGLGIDNCRVEVNTPETPGLDGSSLGFVKALHQAGILRQSKKAEIFQVQHPMTVSRDGMMISIVPCPNPEFQITYTLDYSGVPPIGIQIEDFTLTDDSFARELASARTFVLDQEIKALHAAGIGRHCTCKDLVIFEESGPVDNPLRFHNEPVRHKMLDVIGDLSLLGQRIHGHVIAYKSGHTLNAELVGLMDLWIQKERLGNQAA